MELVLAWLVDGIYDRMQSCTTVFLRNLCDEMADLHAVQLMEEMMQMQHLHHHFILNILLCLSSFCRGNASLVQREADLWR